MLNKDWEWYQQKCLRGKELVDRMHPEQMSQLDFYDASFYYKDQEAMVSIRGQCDGGCCDSKFIVVGDRTVCRQTLEPCRYAELLQISTFYQEAFGS